VHCNSYVYPYRHYTFAWREFVILDKPKETTVLLCKSVKFMGVSLNSAKYDVCHML
jgi:hypothetical protein